MPNLDDRRAPSTGVRIRARRLLSPFSSKYSPLAFFPLPVLKKYSLRVLPRTLREA